MKNYSFNSYLQHISMGFIQISNGSSRWMGNSILRPTSTHLAYFWWTPLREKLEIHEKTWWWCQHHVFFIFFCFSWSGVHQKYAKWVLVGCGIEFSIQWVLHLKIYVKPHGDKLKIQVKKVVFHFLLFYSSFLPFY